MAERRARGHTAHRAAHLRDMFDASIKPDGGCVQALVRDILRLGVPPETVTDIYIPEVARRLGAAWVADRLSFVEVSIGTAHLQAVTRELSTKPDPTRRASRRVAVVVPQDEDHTLGAVVLTGKLRRMGIAVALHMCEPGEKVAESLAAERPDAVMISASHADCVHSVSELVEAARCILGHRARVAVGGPILELEGVDVLGTTRADHAVSDPVEALGLCGVMTDSGAASARAPARAAWERML